MSVKYQTDLNHDTYKRNEVLLKQIKDLAEQGLLPDQSIADLWFKTKPIDFYLECYPIEKKILQPLVERLTNEVIQFQTDHNGRKNKLAGDNKKKLRKCVKALVINLTQINNILSNFDQIFLSVSLDSACYGVTKHHEFKSVSFHYFKMVFDAMVDDRLGYIRVYKKGYKEPMDQGGKGHRTCIEATSKLQSLINAEIGGITLDIRQVKSSLHKNSIILRDDEKQSVFYSDTKAIKAWRNNLKDINKLILENTLRLSVSEEDKKELFKQLEEKADKDNLRPAYVDLSHVVMRRIFNNGSFEMGGRYYGGWWQNVPKGFRKHISINGNKMVELDYSEMHLTMLYQEEGLEPPDNPYMPLDYIERDIGKYAFNGLLNTKDGKLYPHKDFKPYADKYDLNWYDFLEEMMQYHTPIENRLCEGYGLSLQYVDSQIAERVMLHFFDKGIVCLPVHDSFIVEEQHKSELERKMKEVALEITGIEIAVK